MIGLSPLPSAHPGTFQRPSVRPSIDCHADFSLAKGRSPGFASAAADYRPCVSGFPAAFPSDARRAMRAALLPRGGLDRPGLGSSPFARHYWGNRFFFLLLQVLGCFGSLRSPLTASFIASGSLGIHRVPLSRSFAHAARYARRRTEPRSSPIDLSCLGVVSRFVFSMFFTSIASLTAFQ